VAENAVVEGNCVLKHRVMVGGHALRGGPILLDDDVLVKATRSCGDVVIEHRVEITDNARIERRRCDSSARPQSDQRRAADYPHAAAGIACAVSGPAPPHAGIPYYQDPGLSIIRP
jgi:ADP-glucose pyrophosphorylase